MVAPDRLLQIGVGVAFEEPPRRLPVPASASGGRRPPEWPPTALGGEFWEREDPDERLLGEDGMKGLLALWRSIPHSERNSPPELRERQLRGLLIGSSLSGYAVVALELIAESQWERRRSPDSIVPLRSKALRAPIAYVFSYPTPDLRLENNFLNITLTNPNGCLGSTEIAMKYTDLWRSWINNAQWYIARSNT